MTSHKKSKYTPSHIIKKLYNTPLNVTKNTLGLNLDLSYIEPNIIICSYPVTNYPKLLYRNSLEDLVTYLNITHGLGNWKLYNLKVEQSTSDYSDEQLLDTLQYPSGFLINKQGLMSRIFNGINSSSKYTVISPTNSPEVMSLENLNSIFSRTGWLDHSPPPFLHLQELISDMDKFIRKSYGNVVVVHCKLGKGRSGTLCMAYMMKYKGLSFEICQSIFSQGRFKPGITNGVTIHSQLRYLKYHESLLSYDSMTQKKILNIFSQKMYFSVKSVSVQSPSKIFDTGACRGFIKFQKYNPRRNGIIDIEEINIKKQDDHLNLDFKESILEFPLILNTEDIRLEFSIHTNGNLNKGHKKIKKHMNVEDLHILTFPYYWFNIPCEFLIQNITEDSIVNEHSIYSQEIAIIIPWKDIDGIKGTSSKGVKLFDSIELSIASYHS